MRIFKSLAGMAVVMAFVAGVPAAWATKVLDLNAIRAQQAEIREGVIAATGRYANIPASTRADLLAKQASLLGLLEGKQNADDLTETQRVEAFNTLEWIEATINNTADERMICHREKTLGSNRLTRVCRTAAEEERMKEDARQRMLNGDPFGARAR